MSLTASKVIAAQHGFEHLQGFPGNDFALNNNLKSIVGGRVVAGGNHNAAVGMTAVMDSKVECGRGDLTQIHNIDTAGE